MLLWELCTTFVAYTSDAYVRSDLISIAPQVTGRIISVPIEDNQTVHRGDLLAAIDPEPFLLAFNAAQASLRQAAAQSAADQDSLHVYDAQRQVAGAALTYAQQTIHRVRALETDSVASRAELDEANEALRRTTGDVAVADGALAKAQQMLAADAAAQARAEAELALAQWRLDRTKIFAPADGTINNLTLRVGDMAREFRSPDRHRRCTCLADHRQLQAVLHSELCCWWHRLGLARQPSVALLSRSHSRRRPRHQPLARGADIAALRRPHHRLDPSATTLSGDRRSGRSATRPALADGGRCARVDLPMSGSVTRSLKQVGSAAAALAREPGTLSLTGPRAHRATMAAAAVALAVPIGCAMDLPDVWWAAISAVISTMPTRPASVEKGLLRLVGTAVGASLAYALIGWIAYDHVACCLALFAVSSIALLGMAVSPHGYAWMFLGVTFTLVVLVSLNDPAQAFSIAVYRTLEVCVGITCAILVATLLAPDAPAAGAAPPEPPGWHDLFGAQWLAVTYALRSGIVIAVLPVIWNTLYLPGVVDDGCHRGGCDGSAAVARPYAR